MFRPRLPLCSPDCIGPHVARSLGQATKCLSKDAKLQLKDLDGVSFLAQVRTQKPTMPDPFCEAPLAWYFAMKGTESLKFMSRLDRPKQKSFLALC